ncbi:hypothetical protein Micbo1qcDRAFT_171857 [Microdochium bolleyi]|uniref:Uncharacterized protein n=1 Tax=Microdochium bolleyi TaxID=196109 RepID=A0A136JE99_9PEZI|nr:hypothetical protein Micbo1qcDRAFT_171857 [Microdochium bolleyi]
MPLSVPRSRSQDPETEIGPMDDESSTILSPSGLLYSMEKLDQRQRDDINETFFTEDIDSFQMVLHDYSLLQDKAKFEVLELNRHTISIPASRHDEAQHVTCNKCESPARECRAGLWLFDQIANQALGDATQPLVMTADGYAEELGDIFEAITDHDIDTLANGMQYNDTYRAWGPVPRRVRESREILASLHKTPISMYRTDLYGPGSDDDDDDIVQENDLEKTIFRMLLRNDQFFKYFLSVMKPDKLVNNRFRKLQHKADCVLAKYLARVSRSDTRQGERSSTEHTKHTRWCAKSLKAIVKEIGMMLLPTDKSLESWQLDSAARALIHILLKLVELNVGINPGATTQRDLNLFSWLIEEQDSGFIVDILQDAVPKDILVLHEEDLIDIRDRLQGVPQSWHDKFCKLIDDDRRTRAVAKSPPPKHKRPGEDNDRAAKRAK